jgi:hypothetical protein
MKQQHIYEQQSRYEHGESSSRPFSYEQEKIKTQRYRDTIILNVILQFVLIFLAVMYSLMTVKDIFSMFISYLLVNVFFFLSTSILSRKIIRSRKTLYICLIFVLSLISFFSSLILITAGASGGLILVWVVTILINWVCMYFFNLPCRSPFN